MANDKTGKLKNTYGENIKKASQAFRKKQSLGSQPSAHQARLDKSRGQGAKKTSVKQKTTTGSK